MCSHNLSEICDFECILFHLISSLLRGLDIIGSLHVCVSMYQAKISDHWSLRFSNKLVGVG